MQGIEPILAEARRIAEQPIGDRLEGKQGEEARSVIIRLLEETGLDFMEAFKLVDSYGWERWTAGSRGAAQDARRTYTTKEN